MARNVQGYVVITDQGDPPRGCPVKYLQVRFPGMGKELRSECFFETEDMHDCTIFNLGKPGHRRALELADTLYQNAVPIKVTVTRTIHVHPEIPE